MEGLVSQEFWRCVLYFVEELASGSNEAAERLLHFIYARVSSESSFSWFFTLQSATYSVSIDLWKVEPVFLSDRKIEKLERATIGPTKNEQ